jgi:hypothetical protein
MNAPRVVPNAYLCELASVSVTVAARSAFAASPALAAAALPQASPVPGGVAVLTFPAP